MADKKDAPDQEKVDEIAAKSKQEAEKLKSEKDVQDFLKKNRENILEIAKKLDAKYKDQFKKIVNALNDNAKKIEEAKNDGGISGSKLILGLAATVAFMCSLNTIGFIMSAPIYAPFLQFAVKKLTGIKEAELDEDIAPAFTPDPATAKILSTLATECKQMRQQAKSKGFEIFEYEGQQLANFWLMLGHVADALSKGYIHKDVAEDLDRVGSYIMNANTHKTPRPTDPRDIR